MRAVTVRGEVDAGDLGITLPHEHLNVDGRFLCTDPDARHVSLAEISRDDLRKAPMRYLANLDMRDERVASVELEAFRSAGGQTLVDLTPEMGESRDPLLLRRLSTSAKVHIIMGTGYYVGRAHPPRVAEQTVDAIAEHLKSEVRIGVGSTGIRAGVIGEIGTSDPMTPAEEKVLRAAAVAHLETGCPLNIHFAAGCREVMRVLDVIQDVGVEQLSRVIVSHLDCKIDLDQQREICSRGAIVEYDTFGHESYPDSRGCVMPRDIDRAEALATIMAEGWTGQLLVSHDICLVSLWRQNGGPGYVRLLRELPTVFESVGISAAELDALRVENPARIFGYLS